MAIGAYVALVSSPRRCDLLILLCDLPECRKVGRGSRTAAQKKRKADKQEKVGQHTLTAGQQSPHCVLAITSLIVSSCQCSALQCYLQSHCWELLGSFNWRVQAL
jgi:hypothetical protein